MCGLRDAQLLLTKDCSGAGNLPQIPLRSFLPIHKTYQVNARDGCMFAQVLELHCKFLPSITSFGPLDGQAILLCLRMVIFLSKVKVYFF